MGNNLAGEDDAINKHLGPTNLPASERAAEKIVPLDGWVGYQFTSQAELDRGIQEKRSKVAAIISSEFAELIRLVDLVLSWKEFRSGAMGLSCIPLDRSRAIYPFIEALAAELRRVGEKHEKEPK